MPNSPEYNYKEWQEFLQTLPGSIKDTVQNKFKDSPKAQRIFLEYWGLISKQIDLIPLSEDRDKELRFFLSILIDCIEHIKERVVYQQQEIYWKNKLNKELPEPVLKIIEDKIIQQDIVSIRAYQRLERNSWSALFIKVLAVFESIALKLGWKKLASFLYQKQVNHNCQHHQDILDKQKKIYEGEIKQDPRQWFNQIIDCQYEMKNPKGLEQAYLTRPKRLGNQAEKIMATQTLDYLYRLKNEEGVLRVLIEVAQQIPMEVQLNYIEGIGSWLYSQKQIKPLLDVIYQGLSNEDQNKLVNELREFINHQATSWKVNTEEQQSMDLLFKEINTPRLYQEITSFHPDQKLSTLAGLIEGHCSLNFDENPDEEKSVRCQPDCTSQVFSRLRSKSLDGASFF